MIFTKYTPAANDFKLGNYVTNKGLIIATDTIDLKAGTTNNTAVTINDSTDTLQIDAANIVIDTTLDVAPGKIYTERSIPVTVNGVSYYIPLFL